MYLLSYFFVTKFKVLNMPLMLRNELRRHLLYWNFTYLHFLISIFKQFLMTKEILAKKVVTKNLLTWTTFVLSMFQSFETVGLENLNQNKFWTTTDSRERMALFELCKRKQTPSLRSPIIRCLENLETEATSSAFVICYAKSSL